MTGISLREPTRLIHDQRNAPPLASTPAPPVQRASTVLLDSSACFSGGRGPTYGRGGLATHDALRSSLADLEHAEAVQLYPSGLAAVTAAIQALVAMGDEILVVDSVYNPTRRFLEGTMRRFGVTVRYFPATASSDDIAAMIRPETQLLVLESPGSLTLDMQDIPAIATMARSRGVRTMIDNTFAAGVTFKPLDHGIDVSVQALTKYVCGHSDVFMGMSAASGDCAALLARNVVETGWTVSADDAYLALRGLKTLHARMAQHGESALRVAAWLCDQQGVRQVFCPALPGAPGHALWARDFSGTCGLITIVLEGDDTSANALLDTLALFGLGYSWGGYESLAIPCGNQLAQRCFATDPGGPVIRLHVGLEHPDDLIADLRRGLDAAAASLNHNREKKRTAAA